MFSTSFIVLLLFPLSIAFFNFMHGFWFYFIKHRRGSDNFQKDSITHMHGFAVYVIEGLSFARDLSLENSADSYLCFRLASLSYFFFLYRLPSSTLCTVFDSISSNIEGVLSINPSANVFVFGDFNVHHKGYSLFLANLF